MCVFVAKQNIFFSVTCSLLFEPTLQIVIFEKIPQFTNSGSITNIILVYIVLLYKAEYCCSASENVIDGNDVSKKQLLSDLLNFHTPATSKVQH